MTSTSTPDIFTDRRAARVPGDAAETLDHLLAARVSYRAFLPDEVPADVIRRILTTAQLTASWCNAQAWELSITRGAGTERLRDAMYAAASSGQEAAPDIEWPREYRGVHRDRRRESGFQLYEALGIARDDHARRTQQMLENFRFFGAPHVAILHTDEALGPYGAVDCGGYVANFLNAATANGVGTVAQAALAMYPDVLRRELGLADDRNIVCGISFGYPDLEHPADRYRTTRADIDDVVTWVDA